MRFPGLPRRQGDVRSQDSTAPKRTHGHELGSQPTRETTIFDSQRSYDGAYVYDFQGCTASRQYPIPPLSSCGTPQTAITLWKTGTNACQKDVSVRFVHDHGCFWRGCQPKPLVMLQGLCPMATFEDSSSVVEVT